MSFYRRNKDKIKFALKIFFSLALLFAVFNYIDWKRTYEIITKANLIFIILAVLLSIIMRFVTTHKWQVLLSARGETNSFWNLFMINLIGAFWGLFLPSSVSVDIVRGAYLSRSVKDKALSVSSVIIDRYLGVLSLALVAIIGLALSEDLFAGLNLEYYIAFVSAALAISYILLQSEKIAEFIGSKLKKINNRTASIFDKISNSFKEYKKYPKAAAYAFAVSIIIQALRIFEIYLISKAFGVEVSLFALILIIPIIMIIIMTPISFGGYGLREASFVIFFGVIGVPEESAFLVAFTSSLLVTLISLLGGFSLFLYKKEAAQ